MPIIPGLCAACGGGGASDAIDAEPLLLCDINPATGEVVGSAIAVYTYDDTGAPTGPPTFVIPGTNTPYVVQFMLQPCDSEGQSAVVELCDVQLDGSSVQFVRHYIFGPTGTVASFHDSLADGSIYVPTGTVQDCDPYALCTPDSNIDLNANCGPGESPVQATIAAAPGAPLANSVFVDDATADPLCGGTWDRPASALPVGFPVEESFRNTTFDDPGPSIGGTPTPFLTAGPPVNDGNGAGWFREADTSGGSNGFWQVATAFPTNQGMNAAISWASHDGTIPGGDGQYFVFTDGTAPLQANPIGGFGNLGLQNWQGGVFAIVLDEYGQTCTCSHAIPPIIDPNPGPCGFCSNSISIQLAGASRVAATCACCTIASMPLNPKALNQTTRSQPVRLLTSVVTEAGQTYVSASLDWNDGNGPIQYFNRVNITACVTVPATLRMAAYSGSGGAFQAIKEIRDAIARPAGVSNWRAFPITTDPIVCPGLGTVSLVNINASVDVTPNDDGSQTTGNGNPELYFWLVNTATNTIVDSDQISIIPSQLGNLQTMTVSASVPPGDVPNLRLYVGAESRDDTGEYDSTWENLTVSATAAGCPAAPRRTMEISARCPIPVTIVGGGTDDGGGGGTTVVNTPSTFEDAVICATIAGVQQPAFRREIHLADGTIDVTFIGTSGLPITPDAWTAGACPCGDVELLTLCDDNGAFVRQVRYACDGTILPVPGGSDVTLGGLPYIPVGTVRSCEGQVSIEVDQTLGPVCYVDNIVPITQTGFLTLDQDDNPVLYSGTGVVVVGATIVVCPENTIQGEILCDLGNANHQFLRWYLESPIVGVSTTVYNFELDGNTVYVPVGPVGLCDASSTNGLDVEVEVLCDSTPTRFLRKYVYNADTGVFVSITNTLLDGTTAFAPVGAVSTCPIDIAQEDDELLILCSSTPAPGTQFLRRYRLDAESGAVIGVVNTALDGTTPFVPGVVSVCTATVTTDFDFTEEVLCDANNTAFIRRFTFNSQTGAVTATTNLTLAGAAFVPVGAVGLCSTCCPVVIGQGCTNVGSLTYVAIRNTNGTISLLDAVTGVAILAANIVACTPANGALPATVAADHFEAVPGTPWTPAAIPAGRRLVGLSYTVLTGTATTVDATGATAIATIPAGYNASWNANDDRETLTPPASITSVGGRIIVTMVTAL